MSLTINTRIPMIDNKNEIFWMSYSDLMTSMFFIMLIILLKFIAFSPVRPNGLYAKEMLRAENDSLRMVVEETIRKVDSISVGYDQLQSILKLEEQFRILSESSTLRYDKGKRTFIAKELEGIEIFEPLDDKIRQVYREKVLQVGKDLEKLLYSLNRNNPNFKFLLVIEGTSANNDKRSMDPDRGYNYHLSYGRALSLYKFWMDNNIDLRRYNTDIQICGSGLNGINRDDRNEANNKRFMIQILPKLSRPNPSK